MRCPATAIPALLLGLALTGAATAQAPTEYKLTVADAAAGFGSGVALSGDTAVVGAPDDDAVDTNAGSAYVFVRSGATWTQQQKLIASDASAGDRFGFSVALSGDTVVIGAIGDDDAAGFDKGSAYVFVRTGTTWSQQAKLTINGSGSSFGGSVAVSGDTALVGCPSGSFCSMAYVFVRTGTAWTQQQNLVEIASEMGWFGESVAISGDTALVTARSSNITLSWRVFVFERTGTTWSEQAKLTPSDGLWEDRFGSSLGLSGDTALALPVPHK